MTKSNITLRLERPEDYRIVEELTREAFWKNSRHICDEHLLVNRLRRAAAFVPELDYVAEVDGKLVGHIIYSKSRIEDASGKTYETLTFGPLSVLPGYQNTGVGKALMLHTFAEARRLGYRAVLIFGHPDYYPRVGFRRASEFGITTADGMNFDPFMALPLYDGALDGIYGRYFIDPVYNDPDEKDVLEFEKGFPPKEKFVPVPISVLLCRLEPDARKAIEGLKCPYLDAMRAISERDISALSGIDGISLDVIRGVMLEYGYRWGEERK
jgi:predicted N-acetyltransferase YhbS